MDTYASAASLAAAVRSGDVSAQDYIGKVLERIRDTEKLNIFITVNPDADQLAQRIDVMVRRGEDPGRLAGVPVSIKDNICTRNMRTTCASRMLEEFVPPYDATVVRRLLDEGAVIVGKTNMDEFGMGSSTEFSAFGPTDNPRCPGFVPGGSSGGSAASVATDTSIISLGSDTGGSVRNPASFCGVIGFKPTYGMVSRYGLVSYANSLEQIGPLGCHISDVALAMEIISGNDVHDDTTISEAAPKYAGPVDMRQKKIGMVRQMIPANLDSAISQALDATISQFEKAGARCDEVSLDMVKYSVAAYYTITSTEAASNLARYDNIRYGYNLPSSDYEFHRYVTKSRALFGPEVKRRIITGGFVPSRGYAGKYFLKALKVKSRLIADIRKLFQVYDYLVSPTVPILPFRRGQKTDDPVSLFAIDVNTVTANLTGIPAVSIPVGTQNGPAVGIQIMGRHRADMELLGAAQTLEDHVAS